MEKELYYAIDSTASLQYVPGRQAYESFGSTVALSQIMRQQGEDDEPGRFREGLVR
jgi:hypothetical protein